VCVCVFFPPHKFAVTDSFHLCQLNRREILRNLMPWSFSLFSKIQINAGSRQFDMRLHS
jgi:uncharacterized membrane protein